MQLEDFKKLNLPDKPGVYFFKKQNASIYDAKNTRRESQTLYIGKATSLRDRVRSYFSDDLIKTRGRLLVDMISQAETIEWQETDSVLEAFILETELIKKFQPRYNTKEKDNKSFNYVVFTKEDFPRVLVVRGRNLQLSTASPEKQKEILGYEFTHVFGPYPFGAELREALKLVRRIFPYRDKCEPCEEKKAKTAEQLGKAGKVSRQALVETDGARIFGRATICKPCFNRTLGLCPGVCTGEITKRQYAKRIADLALFFKGEKQKILKNFEKEMNQAAKELRFEDAGEIKRTIQALTHIHDISLIKKESEFGAIRSYDATEGTTNISGAAKVEEITDSGNFAKNIAPELAAVSGPVRVEAYDIAHLSGKDMVGTMVVMEDSEFNNREYKVFNIQSVSSSNDTAALEEVLVRRFAHREWDYPQTIVIDGGIAQLRVAKKVLDMIKGAEQIEIVSVVKDTSHNAREILRIRGARNGSKNLEGPISESLAIKINAECHRFSIKTHRNKRSRGFLKK